MRVLLQSLLLATSVFAAANVIAQPTTYSPANLHAHNDYEKPFPFRNAFMQGFGSIEADIFLAEGQLLVAHTEEELRKDLTLDKLYLQPLDSVLRTYHGSLSANGSRHLQLMIDIKTEAVSTLDALVNLLKKYPALTSSKDLSVVISGNRPLIADYKRYPLFILFDGLLDQTYPAAVLERIPMFSDNFRNYTKWNGKGIIPAGERLRLDSAVTAVHKMGKTIRFWNAPDTINAWYQYMNLKADWINTDYVTESAFFMRSLPQRTYRSPEGSYTVYKPSYKTDGSTKKPKNIILLIGDGMGMAHIYAGYTANRGALNLFSIRNTGLSKTSSYDSYITDSAPGSTAFSSGNKTNNRSVGVDHTGMPMTLLPDIFKKKGMKNGLISSGDLTDATPADFYAHQSERSSSRAIMEDLERSQVDILMGAGNKQVGTAIDTLLPSFKVVHTMDSVNNTPDSRWVVADPRAGLSMLAGRGNWLSQAFDKTTGLLAANPQGFFLMLEGAQIDYGGHANNLPYLVKEMLDFDQVVARALQFADTNGETLVIVTADHETGGLTLLDGDYTSGYVSGQFATSDHTATPVPVFAYGPQSQMFTGVYENTAIFNKILSALGIKL